MAGLPSPLEPSRPVPISHSCACRSARCATTAPCASATMSEPSGATTTWTGSVVRPETTDMIVPVDGSIRLMRPP